MRSTRIGWAALWRLGALTTAPAWGVGIDRFQRIRYVGSHADYRRFNESIGWFDPNVSMAANEARYYDFEAEREARLEADGATVVPLFAGEVISDPGWAGTRGYAEVALPDAATMAGFDTLELDLYLGCVGAGECGDCPAWDYIDGLYLCDAADPGTADDCMQKVDDGTVPNQYGTWWYGRSGWCPGKEVPLVAIDVTADVAPGTDAVFEYRAHHMGSPYPRRGANIQLGSWVVVWR